MKCNKTVLIISISNLDTDPRVNRQIRFLNEKYHVIAAGLRDPNIPGVQFVLLHKNQRSIYQNGIHVFQLLSRQYEKNYWGRDYIVEAVDRLPGLSADLIIANDIITLPLALKLAQGSGSKIIFDAHEYAPREFEDKFFFKHLLLPFNAYLCQTYIPKVAGMMTVCQGIADQFEKDISIRSVVITNAPDYYDLKPCLKPANDDRIRIIHHGSAQPSRKLENMIKVMDYVDNRFELDLLLVPFESRYVKKLKRLARHNERIRFLQPVAMQELVTVSHQYDIGLFLLEPTSFSYLHALPNKFFEFIQARLAVAIGPSPEMAQIVKEYDVGIVADDFQPYSLAEKLSGLTHDHINYYKQQSHKAARDMSAEKNRQTLLDLVARLLK